MGEEFESRAKPRRRVTVRGTAELARIDQSLTTLAPRMRDVDLGYEDSSSAPGLHWYYARVEQADGQLAWSSPIWVHLR